jgi:hypothetical protein
MRLSVTIETPKLKSLRKIAADTRGLNEEICQHFMREIDRNIVEGGIWEKFPPNQPSTTAKRRWEGKDPRPMFGLRGRFKYTIGATQFTIFSNDPGVKFMHYGPRKSSWNIRGNPLSFVLREATGENPRRERNGYLWFVGLKVKHKGWKKRVLLPPALEVGYFARQLVSRKLKEG